MKWTKWQKVEVAHPIFRQMRYDPKNRRQRWPYVEIDGTPYRVRRVVDDNTAWVTEVTGPMEKFAVAMSPSDTPFTDAVGRGESLRAEHRAWGGAP